VERGGRLPRGDQVVMLSPDDVRRVKPPTLIMPTTIPEVANNHVPTTAFGLVWIKIMGNPLLRKVLVVVVEAAILPDKNKKYVEYIYERQRRRRAAVILLRVRTITELVHMKKMGDGSQTDVFRHTNEKCDNSSFA
jgi:hypothetical protein